MAVISSTPGVELGETVRMPELLIRDDAMVGVYRR
jgi:hypothetical protein